MSNLDTVRVLLCACLVFWMHAGFAMLEVGFARQENTVDILTNDFLCSSPDAARRPDVAAEASRDVRHGRDEIHTFRRLDACPWVSVEPSCAAGGMRACTPRARNACRAARGVG